MTQLDMFGAEKRSVFKDIRNQRPSVAEEKATLLLTLGKLINACPASVRDGSVQTVRSWRSAREKADKVARGRASSVHDIRCAISSMEIFK